MLKKAKDTKILVVEDDDVFRARLAKAFRKRGAVTHEASGVVAACALVEAENPSHAVIDLRLEDGSGLEVVEALKARNPQAKALILTGYGDIPTAVAAVRLGAVDYMAKPEGADAILDALFAARDGKPPPPKHPIGPETARREHIERFYHQTGENVTHAARLLNMHRRTLQRILKRKNKAST